MILFLALLGVGYTCASLFGADDLLGLLSLYTGEGEHRVRWFGEHSVDIFSKHLNYYESHGISPHDRMQVPRLFLGKRILIDLVSRHPYSEVVKRLARLMSSNDISLDTVLDVSELSRIDRSAVTLDSVVEGLQYSNDLGERLHKAAANIFEKELATRLALHLTGQKPVDHPEILCSLLRFSSPQALVQALSSLDASAISLKDILDMLEIFPEFPVVQAVSTVFFDKFTSGLSRSKVLSIKPLSLFLAFHSLQTLPESLVEDVTDKDVSASCFSLLAVAITQNKVEIEHGEILRVRSVVDFKKVFRLNAEFPRFSTVCTLVIKSFPATFREDSFPISPSVFDFALQDPGIAQIYAQLAIANAVPFMTVLWSKFDSEFAKMLSHELFDGVLGETHHDERRSEFPSSQGYFNYWSQTLEMLASPSRSDLIPGFLAATIRRHRLLSAFGLIKILLHSQSVIPNVQETIMLILDDHPHIEAITLMSELVAAIDNGRLSPSRTFANSLLAFILYYQPNFDYRTRLDSLGLLVHYAGLLSESGFADELERLYSMILANSQSPFDHEIAEYFDMLFLLHTEFPSLDGLAARAVDFLVADCSAHPARLDYTLEKLTSDDVLSVVPCDVVIQAIMCAIGSQHTKLEKQIVVDSVDILLEGLEDGRIYMTRPFFESVLKFLQQQDSVPTEAFMSRLEGVDWSSK